MRYAEMNDLFSVPVARCKLDIDVKEQDIFEFEGNESIHSLDNNGKDIHLFLYIVNKWTNTPIIKEGIHDELKHIYLHKIHFSKILFY